MRLHPQTDSTLTRLAHRFRRSWRPLSANDNEVLSYWAELQLAILLQEGD